MVLQLPEIGHGPPWHFPQVAKSPSSAMFIPLFEPLLLKASTFPPVVVGSPCLATDPMNNSNIDGANGAMSAHIAPVTSLFK